MHTRSIYATWAIGSRHDEETTDFSLVAISSQVDGDVCYLGSGFLL